MRRIREKSSLFLLLILLGGTVLLGCREQEEAVVISEEPQQEETEEFCEPPEEEVIFVHVCGQVATEGVYELPAGSRVYEAIEKAGGMTEEASPYALNQAECLSDGQKIYVPTKEEYDLQYAGQPEEADGEGKINLNTATKEELCTLPGIGEVKAESILEFREANGKFQSIEQLKEIEGIKDGVFQKVKDRIMV